MQLKCHVQDLPGRLMMARLLEERGSVRIAHTQRTPNQISRVSPESELENLLLVIFSSSSVVSSLISTVLDTMLRYAATANKRHIAAAVGVSGGAVTFYALSSETSEDEFLDAVPHHSQPEHLATGVPHPFVSQLLGGGRSSTSVALTEGTRPAFTVSPRLTRHPFISKQIPSREEQLARLTAGNEEFDVLVVGGGATGSGVALDAQMRGLNTALIERADFSSETSSRSTKLVSLRVGICACMTHGILGFHTH